MNNVQLFRDGYPIKRWLLPEAPLIKDAVALSNFSMIYHSKIVVTRQQYANAISIRLIGLFAG